MSNAFCASCGLRSHVGNCPPRRKASPGQKNRTRTYALERKRANVRVPPGTTLNPKFFAQFSGYNAEECDLLDDVINTIPSVSVSAASQKRITEAQLLVGAPLKRIQGPCTHMGDATITARTGGVRGFYMALDALLTGIPDATRLKSLVMHITFLSDGGVLGLNTERSDQYVEPNALKRKRFEKESPFWAQILFPDNVKLSDVKNYAIMIRFDSDYSANTPLYTRECWVNHYQLPSAVIPEEAFARK